ncbi:hypothetical protein PHAVU_002G033400 [Phaseolus vulgaris]|uniref:Uncharacterized protein n=1 Tax=Phaseolus vulgaris TaxID=3885 RepID=V7CHZ2_PHAVU|nr:hypothetical protein PHAVU_002G033400g [Phaseolus vulgaris]ESW28973.1 hypothetical protein PHAVU_002G033400g [Phaseolus vulgaris]
MSSFTSIALDRLIEPGASNPVDESTPTSIPIPNSQKLERSTKAPANKSKSFSDVEIHDGENVNQKSFDAVVASSAGDFPVTFTNTELVKENKGNGVYDGKLDSSNGADLANCPREAGSSSLTDYLLKEKPPALKLDRFREVEDFFDPPDSMSFASNTDGEENLSMKFSSPIQEYHDAWEEFSSTGMSQNSTEDVDTEVELHEMRLSLLVEIEKRKQAEESLNTMRSQWESIRQGLYQAGVILPAELTSVAKDEQLNSEGVEDICQQVYIARIISNTIGKGIARAEVETEMEAQLQAKNFDIARLLERIRCYETMNREMSQRNQEAVEMARRERQRRRNKRQRWIWGSIKTVISLITVALVSSYLPVDTGSSSAEHDLTSSTELDLTPEHDDVAE